MRRPIVAGNWKMNGSASMARELAGAIAAGAGSECVVLCPPFVYLADVAAASAGHAGAGELSLGAQNVSAEASGAFTGEVSAEMLVDVGCRYVIVGHSERRALYGETDDTVVSKTSRALAVGLVPIVCVGETLDEREAGETEAVVGRQLDAVLSALGHEAMIGTVVAYEPVWAIGTGRTATPEQAQAVHAFLRARVAARDGAVASGLRILYGGSMKAANAAGLLEMPDIDGGLVGGASLVADEFLEICAAARGRS